jgi:hypothetical protein
MSMMLAFLLSTIPAPDITRERVDTIEVNHFFDSNHEVAKQTFTQLLFRKWNGEYHTIIAWRMVNPVKRELTNDEILEHEINAFLTEQNHQPIPFIQAGRARYSHQYPTIMPRYDHARQVWACEWMDGQLLRRVEAKSVVETFTDYDPELAERNTEGRTKELRTELRQPVRGR